MAYSTGIDFEFGISDVYNIPAVHSWTILGNFINYNSLSYHNFESVRYKEIDGARGAMFGLSPASMNQFGNDITRRIILWCTDREFVDSFTVPQGNIAFVVHAVDDQTPVLNRSEALLDSFIRTLDYNDISYISSTRLAVTDLGGAKFLVESSNSLGRPLFDTIASNGVNMVCLSEAIKKLIPPNASDAENFIRKDTAMVACSTLAYLEGLYGGMRVSGGSIVYDFYDYTPENFKGIAYCSGNFDTDEYCAYIYDKENVRATVSGITPDTSLNGDGWEILRRMIMWADNKNVVEPKEIDSGSVVFVIASPDDSTPVLGRYEKELSDTLIRCGYDKVSYISKFRAEITDMSKASLVTSIDHIISKQKIDSIIPSVPVILFGQALASLPGHWNPYYHSTTKVISPIDYLIGYEPDVVFNFGSSALDLGEDSLPKWKTLAIDSSSSSERQMLFSYNQNGIRSAAISFRVQYLSDLGWDLVQRVFRWLRHEAAIEPDTVPRGNVAFVIHDINDSTPYFSAAERHVHDSLVSMNYKDITYVSSARAGVTDFSGAKFVIMTSDELYKLAPDSLLNAGIKVVLLGRALTTLYGDWLSSTSSSNLTPDYDSAFLKNFEAGSYYDCTNGGRYYPDEPANNVFGWTALGRDATTPTNGYHIAFFTERGDAKGAALGYIPDRMNATGWTVFREMIRWVNGYSVNIIAPSNYEILKQNATYVVEWEALEEIDSVTIEFSSDSGQSFQVLTLSYPNTGIFYWDVPGIVSSSCVMRVSAADDHENMDEKYFAIDLASGVKEFLKGNSFKMIQHGNRLSLAISLEEPAVVRADIFSVSGRLVNSFNRKLKAGQHSVDLLKGMPLAAGAYFLQVKLGNSGYRKLIVKSGK